MKFSRYSKYILFAIVEKKNSFGVDKNIVSDTTVADILPHSACFHVKVANHRSHDAASYSQ